ncbi:MAG: hypothetical protein LUH05_02990, partial [Candidatus Gastranaerophilales bacterium]|nr:hypothetical protein [Candidatus Gastranaerophilales bacterium]
MYSDSEKLKRFRKSLDLGQVAFAQALNIARATISMIECGKYKISHTVKEAIKQKYNYDIDSESYITKKEFVVNTSNIVPIPFYEVKAAANPKGEIMVDYPESQALYFDKRWLENILGVNPFNASIIQAKGDSMDSGLNKSTDIKDGDLLLVDNSNINLVNGLIYVIELGYN